MLTQVFLVLAFLGLSAAVVMAPSAAVYALVGLKGLSKGALVIAGWAFATASLALMIDVLASFTAALPFPELMNLFVLKSVEFFWEALRTPTEISVRLLGHYGRPCI
jgi:hypothetical protein